MPAGWIRRNMKSKICLCCWRERAPRRDCDGLQAGRRLGIVLRRQARRGIACPAAVAQDPQTHDLAVRGRWTWTGPVSGLAGFRQSPGRSLLSGPRLFREAGYPLGIPEVRTPGGCRGRKTVMPIRRILSYKEVAPPRLPCRPCANAGDTGVVPRRKDAAGLRLRGLSGGIAPPSRRAFTTRHRLRRGAAVPTASSAPGRAVRPPEHGTLMKVGRPDPATGGQSEL